jgi:hypothetical protein
MDELANQWYQAGSLLVQAGFLIAGVWSVRAILKNMRASQEQMGALLKLTVSGGASGEESLRTDPSAHALSSRRVAGRGGGSRASPGTKRTSAQKRLVSYGSMA